MSGYPAVVRRARGSRARFGLWTGEDGPGGSWPLLLVEGVLTRGYARPGRVIEVVGVEPGPREAYGLLARHEKKRSFEDQARWLRENFPDSFPESATVEEALIQATEA